MPRCHQRGCSPAAPAQGEQGRNGGRGWGQPQPGWDPRGSLSKEMVQSCLEAPPQGMGNQPPWHWRRLQSLLSCSESWHRQSLSLVFPHFSLFEFSQCSFLSLMHNFILRNLCFWLKEKCVFYEWSFYLSILRSPGISIFYTGNLGLKKFTLEYSILELKMPCKHEYQVFLFRYTFVNKQKSLWLGLRPKLFKVRGIVLIKSFFELSDFLHV